MIFQEVKQPFQRFKNAKLIVSGNGEGVHITIGLLSFMNKGMTLLANW